ncbi:RNA polymerase sigma factor [Sphingomonas sp. SORGH_AS_0950]|uniref:RNA polymerase sigma factor n=1 Tax=Sphingomonas sp. SORGH_AS_0950 TaxID=3041792 RepID=UPI0027D86BF4|nr:RNA polymerase sigma factor [Sphingomonas sp. SORGH_AS_0950]
MMHADASGLAPYLAKPFLRYGRGVWYCRVGSCVHDCLETSAVRSGVPAAARRTMTVPLRRRSASRPSREADALEHLFRTEAPRLRHYFRSRTGDTEVAADLVQETFLKMTTSTNTRIVNPAAYLQRIARNLLVDLFRARRRQAHEKTVPIDECDLVFPPFQEEISRYEEAIRGLSEKTRQVFLLQRLEGLTYEQISVQLRISTATVEYHMMRALAHLDRVLEEM